MRGDDRSAATLSFILNLGYAVIVLGDRYFVNRPPQAETIHRLFQERQPERALYPPYPGGLEAGSFCRHHGLRGTCSAVRAYVVDKEIWDVGAYHGESLMVFERYTNVLVRSFELMKSSYELSLNIANQMNRTKHVVHHMGLAKEPGTVHVAHGGGIGSSVHQRGNIEVPLNTIDRLVEAQNLSVGFIKIDIEGTELQVLQGGIRTLKAQHPILSLSSYHNIELYDIPVFLEEVGGYRLEFENQGDNPGNLFELAILAYPESLQIDYAASTL
jgi:FkbM family methyltransferase